MKGKTTSGRRRPRPGFVSHVAKRMRERDKMIKANATPERGSARAEAQPLQR